MAADDRHEIARLEALLAERTAQLQAVHNITAALSSKTDLDALLQETLGSCLAAVRANAGSILLHDDEDRLLRFRYVVGDAAAILTGTTLDPSQGIAGEVFRTGTPKISRDVTQEKSHFKGIDQVTQYETRNMVTVPLKSIVGEPVGVMQILNKEGGGFFDDHDIETLMILSAQAASAIENARLFEEARVAVVVKLMGDISHDVKNMITPVSVCAQTLEMMFESYFAELERLGAKLEAPAAERLERASLPLRDFYPEAIRMFLDGSEQVQARVREIADCVKGIVAEPRFEPTEVNAVVEAVATPLRLVAERGDLVIDLTGLSHDLPPAELDQKQLYNCIYNLINNAIPETPAGGRIYVATANGVGESGAEGLLIRVRDTGRGMPAHVRERLFTKNAVSTKPGGTGLGTQIVKNVVDAHHGTIRVASEEGVGTEFTIWLPVRQPGADADGGGR